jgi:glycosyltransferase involved in cell wall biosynthesis
MNILYLADPNSIHDLKWISFFSLNKNVNAYILPQTGHRQRFIASGKSGQILKENKIHLLPAVKEFSILRFYRTFYDFQVIKNLIKRKKIDLIHVMYAEPSALWGLGRRCFNTPMILTTRGTDILYTIPETFKKNTAIDFISSRLYKKAIPSFDEITVTSQEQRRMISTLTGRVEGIEVLRTGVDIDAIRADTTNFMPEILSDRNFILFPRLMRPIYNHEFSIEAIALLPDIIIKHFTVVFLGADGTDIAYIQRIKQKMVELGTTVDVVFLPVQSQLSIWELYKRASVVVMTPKSDGSPVSAMEAAICNTPVILPPLNYDDEIFDEYFYKLKCWDPKELAVLIERVLLIGNSVKTSIVSKYDRKEYMEKLWIKYNALLHER